MPLITAHRVAALLAALSVAGCGAGRATEESPFAGVPAAVATASPGFVGLDDAGVGLAVRFLDDGTAVACLCDGDGVGTWFTGTVAADGALALTAANGTTLTASRSDGALVGTHGAGVAFALAPAAAGSGLFRDTVTVDGRVFTSGWVIGNDGAVLGRTTGEDGGAVVTVAEGPDDGPATGAGVTGSGPAPTGLIKTVRCGIQNFRIGYNAAQFNNAASGSAAQADAAADGAAATGRAQALGCPGS